MIGHRNIDGTGTPIKDNMIWLGGAQLNPGDWLFVYTAAGQTTPQLIEGTTSMLYSIYWGKDHTIFQNNGLVPMLCQIGMIAMPQIPLPQAQNNRLGVY